MAARDTFLDLLADAPVVRRAEVLAPLASRSSERKPLAMVGPNYKPGTTRPSFADEIDAMVLAMVAAGDVVLDAETDQYRAPWCRRFKFG